MYSSGQKQCEQQPVSDAASLALLYQKYSATVLTSIRGRIAIAEDAEDVLVEVFLAAFEYKALIELDEGQQLAWLRRVAYNKCIDHHRRSSYRIALSIEMMTEAVVDNEDVSPDQITLRNEAFSLLRRHIARLPELYQEVLRLRFTSNLRAVEIGKRLHKSEGAVRTILSRSLALLRTFYKESGEDTTHEYKR